MSITISANPISLLSGIVDGIKQAQNDKEEYNRLNDKLSVLMQKGSATEEELNEIFKEFLTVFMDKDLLVKTLTEHGAENVNIDGENISCNIDCFSLEFIKIDNNTENKPSYTMKIKADCEETKLEELITDITNEYTMNTQEETYIKIKERLDKQGLQIDEEEVLEDNSIMLTVNID